MAVENKYASDLAVVPARGNLVVVASDPNIPAGPGKESVATTVAAIRSGVKVVLTSDNSPLAVEPGQTVYVDSLSATGPLVAILPTVAPAIEDSIRFIPMGSYIVHPLHVDPGPLPVAGEPGELIEVTTDDLAFEVRWINATYGYGFFHLGDVYTTSNVTVNASDLVSIRYITSGPIQLLPTDRECGVASLSDTDSVVKLPLASEVSPGWQGTFMQLGNGKYTFELNAAAAPGEEIIALGEQYISLGKGSFVTVLLTANSKWVIGGGLTGV